VAEFWNPTGRADRRLDDPHAIAGEHRVKRRRELADAVAVADQELEPVGTSAEVDEQVTGLLGGLRLGRVGGDTQDVHPPGLDFHHEQ
jgi:hypothetical protein